MTIGKDVSGLFADVVKNMQTEDLELKKLVYLYLMNYAKSQPELVILAINTFVKARLAKKKSGFLAGLLTILYGKYRTRMIRIRSYELWQSALWAV